MNLLCIIYRYDLHSENKDTITTFPYSVVLMDIIKLSSLSFEFSFSLYRSKMKGPILKFSYASSINVFCKGDEGVQSIQSSHFSVP